MRQKSREDRPGDEGGGQKKTKEACTRARGELPAFHPLPPPKAVRRRNVRKNYTTVITGRSGIHVGGRKVRRRREK